LGTEIVSVIGILQKAFWPPSQRSVLRLIAAPYRLIPVILEVVLGDATQGVGKRNQHRRARVGWPQRKFFWAAILWSDFE
jgi:hypothetical protein